MRIISFNVNGLRSIHNKGILKTIHKLKADILCFQEIKINKEKLRQSKIKLPDYYSYFNFAQKPGYSGTAVFTKQKPIDISKKLEFKKFDAEGRLLKLDFANFSLINLYMPHGGRYKENLSYKLKCFNKIIKLIKKNHKNLVLIGDFNIAHTELDLARPQNNQNNIMFTPKERAKISKIIGSGFIDTFRNFHASNGHYTWWPYRFNARQRNLGWRLDYCFISHNLKSKLSNTHIFKNFSGSDHCPIGIDINL